MPEPDAIERLQAAALATSVRPVGTWHPAHCGPSHMRILASGAWLHEGNPIRRPELVRLFASILRREPDGSYVLVTPGERLTIDVDDAPFVAVEVASEGQGPGRRLAFRLNTGEAVEADADHPITLRDGKPYLAVRPGLEARVERAVYYELAELALAEDGALHSNGARFAFT